MLRKHHIKKILKFIHSDFYDNFYKSQREWTNNKSKILSCPITKSIETGWLTKKEKEKLISLIETPHFQYKIIWNRSDKFIGYKIIVFRDKRYTNIEMLSGIQDHFKGYLILYHPKWSL